MNRGYSENDSIKIKEIQSDRSKLRKDIVSHFQKSYWVDKGFTEKDYFKILKKNKSPIRRFL